MRRMHGPEKKGNSKVKWSRGRELNSRPADYESAALPLSYLGSAGSAGERRARINSSTNTLAEENRSRQWRAGGILRQRDGLAMCA